MQALRKVQKPPKNRNDPPGQLQHSDRIKKGDEMTRKSARLFVLVSRV
jgi:hypothetical protein